MSNPTQPRTINGRFGTVDHSADGSIDLNGPTAAGQALSAHLASHRDGGLGRRRDARVQLLSVKIAAQGVLRQWPDAPTCRWITPTSGTGDCGSRGARCRRPGARLRHDGALGRPRQRRTCASLIDNLNDDRGDWSVHRTYANSESRASGVNPCLDLKKAAAMTTKEIGVEHRRAGVQLPSAEQRGSGAPPLSAKIRGVCVSAGRRASRLRIGPMTITANSDGQH